MKKLIISCTTIILLLLTLMGTRETFAAYCTNGNFSSCTMPENNPCTCCGPNSSCGGGWACESGTSQKFNTYDGYTVCHCSCGSSGGPQITENPKGYLDGVNCSTGKAYGWSCDASNYDHTVQVDMWINGWAQYVGFARANVPAETAVADACGGRPNKRFEFILPTSLYNGVLTDLHAWGINTGTGSNTQLGTSPRAFICSAPFPNCRDLTGPEISGGISKVVIGAPANFSANYLNNNGVVTSRNLTVVNNTAACSNITAPIISPGGAGNVNFSWTAPTAGLFTAYCSANNGGTDCRGACVGGPPNSFQCPGSNGAGATTTLQVCTKPRHVQLMSITPNNDCNTGNGSTTINFRYNIQDNYGGQLRFAFYINKNPATTPVEWTAASCGNGSMTTFPGGDICGQLIVPGTNGLTCDAGGNCSLSFASTVGSEYDVTVSAWSPTCYWASTTGATTQRINTGTCSKNVTVNLNPNDNCNSTSATNINHSGYVQNTNLGLPQVNFNVVNGSALVAVPYVPLPTVTLSDFCLNGMPGATPGYNWRLACARGGSATDYAVSGSCARNVNVNAESSITYGFRRIPISGWFQSLNGDVFSGAGISRYLPSVSGTYDTNPFLIDGVNPAGSGTSASGILIARNNIDIRNEASTIVISGSGGSASGPINVRRSAHGAGTFAFPAINFDGPQSANQVSGAACNTFMSTALIDRVYRMDAGCLNSATAVATTYNFAGGTGTVVVYVDGDININRRLQNAPASSDRLILLVDGNVTINESIANVGLTQSNPGDIDATIIARNNITFRSNGSQTDEPIKIDGSVISGGSISFSRNRANSADGNTLPTQVINYTQEDIQNLNRIQYSVDTGLYTSEVTWEVK